MRDYFDGVKMKRLQVPIQVFSKKYGVMIILTTRRMCHVIHVNIAGLFLYSKTYYLYVLKPSNK